MEYHKLSNHEDHWSESDYLRKFMNLKRYDQIHRYFTLRNGVTDPKQKDETFT